MKTTCEYIWIDGDGELRSKTRVIPFKSKIPSWNYDGSSTNQATTKKFKHDFKHIGRHTKNV